MPFDNQQPSAFSVRSVTYDAGLRTYFQKIYYTMALGLIVTGLVAFFTAHSPALMHAIYGNPLMRFVVMLSPLAFIFFGFTPARIQRFSSAQLSTLFLAFSACFGLSLSVIFLIYSGTSIARVFFITSAMFAGTSLYGYTTKKDLSGMGSLMIMGMWGLFVAMIVNIFMHSAAVQFAVSVIGVIVFTGLIAWETQGLKQIYSFNNGTEANNKAAIMGALSLYINFINLFQFLLMLTGGGNRR